MTPDDLYKTILRTLTSVRRVHAEQTTRHTLDGTPHATDAVLDDMARNAAQALIDLLEKQFSVEDVKFTFWKTFPNATNEAWKDFAENLPSVAQELP